MKKASFVTIDLSHLTKGELIGTIKRQRQLYKSSKSRANLAFYALDTNFFFWMKAYYFVAKVIFVGTE